MFDRKKMGARLRLARKKKNFTSAKAAAEWLGAVYETYAGNENGGTRIGLEAAVNYARRFNVSLEWLVLGKGRGPASDEQDRVAELYALIDDFGQWPDEQQRQAIELLHVVDKEVRRKMDTAPTS